jgi:hypothetical protein
MCAAAMALSAMICESSDDLDNIGEWLVGLLLMAVARFAICSWPVGGSPNLARTLYKWMRCCATPLLSSSP